MDEPEGATPFEPEEKGGLIPDLRTREELNDWEQNNILEAERWLFPTRRSLDRVVTPKFVRRLHEKMFEHVWEWAGQFRTTERNIGINPTKISVECRKLCDKAGFWLDEGTYGWLETCARLHHRLTEIHSFPNGNGRHARLYVDYVSHCTGNQRFSWGSTSLADEGDVRERYIKSLRRADRGDLKPLMEFMEPR